MNDSNLADERWYRIAMALLGALIVALAVLVIGGPLIYFDVVHFSLARAVGGSALLGAIIGVFVPAFVLHGTQAAMWFLAGFFGAMGNLRIDPGELPVGRLWLLMAFLVGVLYFFVPALL